MRTAILDKKTISNLKFFGRNISVRVPRNYDIVTPQLFDSNELDVIKFKPSYMQGSVQYMGNIDRVYKRAEAYPLYISSSPDSPQYSQIPTEGDYIQESIDPVRIKYKSTPHLLMSLIDK